MLDVALGSDKEVDKRAHRCVGTIICGVLVDEELEHQGRITRPCVKVVRVRVARTRNDDSRLYECVGWCILHDKTSIIEWKLTYAPDDFAPLGPMFASTPACAMGDSLETYWSTLDCVAVDASKPSVEKCQGRMRRAK